MSEWQAIDTAPMDGAEVILYGRHPSNMNCKSVIGLYQKSRDRWVNNYGSEFCPWLWMPFNKPPTSTGE